MAADSGDWLRVRLRPAETAMAAMAAILWMCLIGAVIASAGMIGLLIAGFGVSTVPLTAALNAVGSGTIHHWLLSVPLWGLAFVGSMLWALSEPEKRQSRLAGLVFGLALALFLAVIATYIPFAQAAASIARPFPNAGR